MTLALGSQAAPFRLPAVAGGERALDDYAQAPALALIWSCNHCPYVRAWEDRLGEIARDAAEVGVRVVAVNANDYPGDSFDDMRDRAAEKGFPFPYVRDASQEVARAYGAERTPEVFLVDPTGTVVYHGAIDDNYDDPAAVREPYLRNAIDALIAERAPEVTQTAPVGCTIKWRRDG